VDGHMPHRMGDIHELLPHAVCWVVVTFVSVLCGAAWARRS
jgi:hypothetical protein